MIFPYPAGWERVARKTCENVNGRHRLCTDVWFLVEPWTRSVNSAAPSEKYDPNRLWAAAALIVNCARVSLALFRGDRVGPHGHVDGLGEVVSFEPIAESWRLVLRAPSGLAKYFAYKGSVAVNGVSLTVNRVDDTPQGCEFSINIIPHTFEVTTLRSLRPGSRVNLEADLIARYVERMLSLERAG